MSNSPRFKLTGGSCIPQGLPARMEILAALEATSHCNDGPPPIGGIESVDLFVTFESIHDSKNPFTGYGRVTIGPDNQAVIMPRFIEDIEAMGIMDLKVGDTFNWPCGCVSIVRSLDELAPAFDSEYDTEAIPDSRQQMAEIASLMDLASMLGIELPDDLAMGLDSLLGG